MRVVVVGGGVFEGGEVEDEGAPGAEGVEGGEGDADEAGVGDGDGGWESSAALDLAAEFGEEDFEGEVGGDGDGDAEDDGGEGEVHVLADHYGEGGRLLVFVVCIDDGLFDQGVEFSLAQRSHTGDVVERTVTA